MITIYDTEVLEIGKPGENGAVRFRFDVEEWLKFGYDGTFSLSHQRATDDYPYPVEVTLQDHYVTWVISDVDNAVIGNGKAELIYSVGDVVVKSATMTTNTRETLDEPDDTPDPYESWIQRLVDVKDEIVEQADYTQGLIDGIPAVVQDYIDEHKDELKGEPGSTVVDEQTKQEMIADILETMHIPTNLSQLTDDLGTRPVHTHSQYLTEHQPLTSKQDKLVSGTNIKTIDGKPVIGSGDIAIRRPNNWAITTGTDFNTLTTDGVYAIGSVGDGYTYLNDPSGGRTWAILFVDHPAQGSTNVIQTLVVNQTGKTWRRQKSATGWSAWSQTTQDIVLTESGVTENSEGGWRWRKYSDGTVEMDRAAIFTANITINTNSTHYRSDELSMELPFTLSEIHNIQMTLQMVGAYGMINIRTYDMSSIHYFLGRFSASYKGQVTVFVSVKGKL